MPLSGSTAGRQPVHHVPLVGLDAAELVDLAKAMGEPAYRGRQLYRALYREQIPEVSSITTLPKALRSALERDHGAGWPDLQQQFRSSDGTVRYLLRLADGRVVESVFLPEEQRDTLCISTQVGCGVDCKFCMTALMGFERNLTAGEIVGQVLALSRDRRLDPHRRPVNIVMMGMGEPLLNLREVMKATRLLADPDALAISQRRITVSTSGIVPRIAEFGDFEVRGQLAVSLNGSSQRQRSELMPVASRFDLQDLLEACRRFPLRPWERLTFEYVLLEGVNDSDLDARRTRRLLADIKCRVNLIALNAGPGIPFEPPSPDRVRAFQSIVEKGMPCFVRKPRGRDIFAACGQLKRMAGA